MKLAEALAERSDCQKRIEILKNRLVTCVRVQEGEQPVEDPEAILVELRSVHARLRDLATRINRTNSLTPFEGTTTLSDSLAERDHLIGLRTSLARVIDAAHVRTDRVTRSEIKFVSTVSVRSLLSEADTLAQSHRRLDSRIQELNWATELLS